MRHATAPRRRQSGPRPFAGVRRGDWGGLCARGRPAAVPRRATPSSPKTRPGRAVRSEIALALPIPCRTPSGGQPSSGAWHRAEVTRPFAGPAMRRLRPTVRPARELRSIALTTHPGTVPFGTAAPHPPPHEDRARAWRLGRTVPHTDRRLTTQRSLAQSRSLFATCGPGRSEVCEPRDHLPASLAGHSLTTHPGAVPFAAEPRTLLPASFPREPGTGAKWASARCAAPYGKTAPEARFRRPRSRGPRARRARRVDRSRGR